VAADDKQGSWWQTLPGVITGLAALVGAVGGVLGILYQAGLLHGSSPTPTARPTISATSVPPKTATVPSVIGVPLGDARQVLRSLGFTDYPCGAQIFRGGSRNCHRAGPKTRDGAATRSPRRPDGRGGRAASVTCAGWPRSEVCRDLGTNPATGSGTANVVEAAAKRCRSDGADQLHGIL
jgi:hypothetical protein